MRTLTLLVLILAKPGVSLATSLDTAAAIDSIFRPWASSTTPGCAVAVVDDGQLVFSQAYGMASLEHSVPNEASTRFEVGSISKQFVATSILMLAEDGKLKLTDDIREYIPEMPAYGEPITIDHLLTHTNGIRDWGFLAELAGWERTTRVLTNADVLDIIIRQKALNFPPGDEYRYTNSGYVLLAIIVERVAGQSLQEYTEEKIFGPLGMKSTLWRDDFRRVVKGQATAYMHMYDRGYVRTMPNENVYGDAGLLTTTGDMLIWNEALSKRRLGDYVATELVRPTVLNNGRQSVYRRGVSVLDRDGSEEISHGGGIGAYRAWLGRFPEYGLSVAVACNAGYPDYKFSGSYFGYRVADVFLPKRDPIKQSEFPTKAKARSGLFVSELTGMPVKLVRVGSQLVYDEDLSYDNERDRNRSLLRALSTERMALDNGNELVFETSNRFRLESVYGNVEEFRRIEPASLKEVELRYLTGRFHNEEIDTTFIIEKEKNGLVLRIDGHPSIFHPLKPVYRDAFAYDTRMGPNSVLVRFYRDGNGSVDELGVGWRNQRVRDLRFSRVQQQ